MAMNDDDIDIDLQYPEPDDAEYEQDADILVYISDSMDQWARNLRRIGHRDLATEASALASWRPRSRKTAVVGRAGSGKSTVMNAILQAPVLSTSSVGRACTTFPTEVIYEGENEYRAVISYVSKQQWEKTLTLLLNDINPDEDDFEDLFEAPDTSPSVEAEAALLSVYPHHKATFDDPIPNIQLTVNNLLDDPVVAPLLGGEQHFTALSAESLEQELDGYLSGCRHDPSKPVLWSLVDIVRIYGPFEVLRSGMILVDLPGYGDRNAVRAKRADDYLEEADNLILVCGIDRAVDEKETKDWMVKCIKRFAVFDNHKVEDGGLTVVITGLDRHVLEKDVRAYLTEEQANTLKDFQMASTTLSSLVSCLYLIQFYRQQGEQATKHKIVARRKINEAKTRKNSKLKSPMLRSQAERDMNLAIAEHEQHLTTLRLIAEKMQLFFAHVREDEVRSSVQSLYRATMLSTQEGQDLVEIESIPVFVVGALDFFCLSGLVTLGTQCQVFNNINATGVPALQAYIRTTGEKYFLSTVKGILVRGHTLLAEVQGRLEATVRQNMESLSTYESDAGSLFDALKVENVKTLLTGFKIIDEDQKSMETALREGALRAVVACPAAVKVLAKFKSNTYQALMRRNGILGDTRGTALFAVATDWGENSGIDFGCVTGTNPTIRIY
ncbi:hypothetical protein BV22DRAFT_1198964 [Leucogyrophana mollusca]|uniref:Uncharacterized protein n=1 Tax=Leucogyrophana mollusca TaxID=85980 RepID=A0ACB8B509_9AGAM|nr:hypothetical protein BV22DRAFT_1198964 [Leucogyrophana mollusca]